MRPLRVAARVRDRVRRRRRVDRAAQGGLPLQLPDLVLVGAVVLARGVVEDDPEGAVPVELEAEEVGHRPVAAVGRAADSRVADLPVVHRLLGEPLLGDRRLRGRGVRDHGGVAVPLDGRGALRVGRPVREAVGAARRVRADPGERERARRASLRPKELVRRRRSLAHAGGNAPRAPLVRRVGVVDGVVVRVDPGGVDVSAAVDGHGREEVVRAAAAGRARRVHVPEPNSGALAGLDVADRDAHVVAHLARVVQVPLHRVEPDLAAAGVAAERRGRARVRVLPDEAAGRVVRPLRPRRRVDVDPDGRLVEGHEDRVVVRGRRGPVVDGVPLPVDRRVLHRERVLAPVLAVVVRDRGAEVHEPLEVDEVDVALVVLDHVRVAAAGRRVGPDPGRAVDVEAEPAVRGAVDEGQLRRGPPRPRLPVVAVARDEVDRLALGPLRVDDRRRRERELPGRVLRGRRRARAAGRRAGHADGRPGARRIGAGVGERRREPGVEGAHLRLVDARRERGARVVDLLGAGCGVRVRDVVPLGVEELERDVVGRHRRSREDVDRRLARDDRDRMQRPAGRWDEAAAEGAAVRARARAGEGQGDERRTGDRES